VRDRGVVVPRFWWRRDAEEALRQWQAKHPSELVTLGELEDQLAIATFEGHGSPPADARATGNVPYVKVTDLKNWRVNENPTNFVHEEVANRLKRRGTPLCYGDLLTPSRASSNIGQFSLVLPWQTHVLLTREVFCIRVLQNQLHLSSYLLLALLSLKVVQDQFKTLALMQTNREHLGDHWREVLIPLPATREERLRIELPVKTYFKSIVTARESWDNLASILSEDSFGTRP
jgi:type I restriction enzyme M protein